MNITLWIAGVIVYVACVFLSIKKFYLITSQEKQNQLKQHWQSRAQDNDRHIQELIQTSNHKPTPMSEYEQTLSAKRYGVNYLH